MNKIEDPFLNKIQSKIHVIRGQRVMLDSDLAILYGVETKVLNQAVKRNIDRFPGDFCFQLSEIEEKNLKSQIVTSNSDGGRRYLSLAFTEQGIAMLSTVLKSKTAIHVNIEIMRSFVRLKNIEIGSQSVWVKIDQLEKKYDANFSGVFEAIRQLMSGEVPNQRNKIKPMNEK